MLRQIVIPEDRLKKFRKYVDEERMGVPQAIRRILEEEKSERVRQGQGEVREETDKG